MHCILFKRLNTITVYFTFCGESHPILDSFNRSFMSPHLRQLFTCSAFISIILPYCSLQCNVFIRSKFISNYFLLHFVYSRILVLFMAVDVHMNCHQTHLFWWVTGPSVWWAHHTTKVGVREIIVSCLSRWLNPLICSFRLL